MYRQLWDLFLRQSIRGGRCTALNRYYKSKVVDKIFRTISEDLNLSANLHEVIEAYVKYMSKGKTKEIEFDSNFGAYGTIDEKKETYVKKSTQQTAHS